MADTLEARHLDQLRRSFRGEVITSSDPSYDEARRLWNSLHDRRPAVLVRPGSASEVATAIRFGRDHDLELAVRAGGHSSAGHSGCDGGIVIDLSSMRGVTVDPAARTARVNGGALLGELDVAAQGHGLVCPVGVVGHTGVAGLTLGGGIGRLQRRFGLTIDNLRSVELVTANGRLVRASVNEEPDLFWGVRGAGWNFGIVTSFEFGLEPFGPRLHRGVRTFARSDVQAAWEVFRAYAPSAPEAVALIFGIDRAERSPDDPSGGEPIAYIAFNHSGAADAVEGDTEALRRGPKPVSETATSESYLDVQTAHDLVLGPGHRSFIKGHNANAMRSEALDEIVDLVAAAPGEGTFSVTALGGAIGRTAEEATAYAGRSAVFDLSADTAWHDPALDDANRDWVRRVMEVVEPDATLGRYANENADVGPEATRAIYGDEKLARLADLKRTWDPDNVFHLNHNVAPSAER